MAITAANSYGLNENLRAAVFPSRKTGVMPLMQVFVSISDPRSPRHTQHDLAELLTTDLVLDALSMGWFRPGLPQLRE